MSKINQQEVEDEIVGIATDDEGLDTAVVSFFDVNYVRTAERNEYGEFALERATDRRIAKQTFLKR